MKKLIYRLHKVQWFEANVEGNILERIKKAIRFVITKKIKIKVIDAV